MALKLTQAHRHALKHLFSDPRVGNKFSDALDNKNVLVSPEVRRDLAILMASPVAGKRIADAIDTHGSATLTPADRIRLRIAFADLSLADRIADSIEGK